MEKNKNTNFQALVNLLDEPDESVFLKIKEEIFHHGDEILPYIQEVYDNSFDSILRRRSYEIINEIYLNSLLHEFIHWDKGNQNIERANILISRIQNFEVSIEDIMSRFAFVLMDVWRELNDHLTALEKVKIINHILFSVHRFQVYSYDETPDEQYFISFNLAYKRATEVSICALYLWIAEKLSLPVRAVILPRKVLLAYLRTEKQDPAMAQSDVLFYINPAERGNVFSHGEMKHFLTLIKARDKMSYLEPVSNRQFVKYYLRKIKNIESRKYKSIVEEIELVLP